MKTLDLNKIKNKTFNISEEGEMKLVYEGKKDSRWQDVIKFVVEKPNLQYDIKIKAVLWENAFFDIEAVLRIETGAKETNTYLKIDCLMMSDRAQARVIPSLEIMEDSVKSGHGATVSSIDEEQLYYLMSRGITKAEAENLIVEGFLK